MYTERNGNFSIRNVILQFLFIALFIFILIWLFPMKKDVNRALKDSGNTPTQQMQDMSVFYDQIFNTNVIAMKESAKSYYTTERLPQKIGDKVSMNLGEMLQKKIILPFVDKDGKQCDLVDSYVEVTKYDTEFVMKVNLKCSNQENYLLVYMGCYDYCQTAICEKNEEDVKTPVIYDKETAKPVQPQPEKPVQNQVITNNITNITNNITNNVITNITNNITNTIVVPEPKPEPTPKPEVSTPSCKLKVVSGNQSGNFYTGDVVIGFASKDAGDNATLTGFGLGTNVNYNGDTKYTLTKPGKYTVYGYVKNNHEKTAVCSIDVNIEDEEDVKEYEYEYVKKTTTCSNYSEWSNWSETKTEPTANRQVEYRKIKRTTLTGYNTITTNDKSKPIYGVREVAIGTLSQTVCTEYGYTKTGEVAYTAWEDAGYVTSTSILKNTDLERYIPVTDTETLCQSYCSSTTGHVYKKQVRRVVYGATYSCKNTATVTKLITANQTVITGYEKITTREPVYETKIITQYRYRTRTCNEKEDKKWSIYNDTKLLNSGYRYTGNKREK